MPHLQRTVQQLKGGVARDWPACRRRLAACAGRSNSSFRTGSGTRVRSARCRCFPFKFRFEIAHFMHTLHANHLFLQLVELLDHLNKRTLHVQHVRHCHGTEMRRHVAQVNSMRHKKYPASNHKRTYKVHPKCTKGCHHLHVVLRADRFVDSLAACLCKMAFSAKASDDVRTVDRFREVSKDGGFFGCRDSFQRSLRVPVEPTNSKENNQDWGKHSHENGGSVSNKPNGKD